MAKFATEATAAQILAKLRAEIAVGSVGPKGDTGAVGPAGVAGPKGDTGAAGPAGATPSLTQFASTGNVRRRTAAQGLPTAAEATALGWIDGDLILLETS